jgi:hypothetical protein
MNIEVKVIEIINEDGIAYSSNSSTTGMGPITAAQPSLNAGTTIGSAFTSGCGTIGSGDIGTTLSGNPYQKETTKKGASKKLFDLKQDYTKEPKKSKKSKLKKFSSFAKK